jgi:uncharacterized protein YndB with AHSA1/START domain
MSDEADGRLDFDCELEAPPEKVWRALTIPALRERWLGADAPAEPEVIAAEPPHRLSWSWREDGEPDGVVTFTLTPTESGGTALRLVHRRAAQPVPMPAAANGNVPMMLAA